MFGAFGAQGSASSRARGLPSAGSPALAPAVAHSRPWRIACRASTREKKDPSRFTSMDEARDYLHAQAGWSGPVSGLLNWLSNSAFGAYKGGLHIGTLYRQWLSQTRQQDSSRGSNGGAAICAACPAVVSSLAVLMLVSEHRVQTMADKHPQVLDIPLDHVAQRLLLLKQLLPDCDVARMVELQPLLLLQCTEQYLTEVVKPRLNVLTLELPGARISEMVQEDPRLLFEDLESRNPDAYLTRHRVQIQRFGSGNRSPLSVNDVISVDVMITENHLGRFDMTICDVNAKPGDGKCTQLNRADGKGKYWYLPFLANWSGGNRGVEKPAYSDGSFGWYLMPAVTTAMGCNMTDIPCDHYNDIVIYRTRWQLPPGFTCAHCKLQWHYLTAQSCWPPCPIKNKDEVTCKNAQAYETCGQPKAQYPEEFWNCADVAVLSKANAGATDPGTANKAAWESQVSVSYAPYGVPRTYQLTGLEWSVMELPRPLDSVAPGRL